MISGERNSESNIFLRIFRFFYFFKYFSYYSWFTGWAACWPQLQHICSHVWTRTPSPWPGSDTSWSPSTTSRLSATRSTSSTCLIMSLHIWDCVSSSRQVTTINNLNSEYHLHDQMLPRRRQSQYLSQSCHPSEDITSRVVSMEQVDWGECSSLISRLMPVLLITWRHSSSQVSINTIAGKCSSHFS